MKYNEKLYEIFDFTKPKFKYYISFETISNDKNNKSLYIVNLENKDSIRIVKYFLNFFNFFDSII